MKTAIITGISSGLGKAFFDILKKENFHIIAISRRFLEDQQALVEKCPTITLIKQDLADHESLKKSLQSLENIIAPDTREIVLISNAGTVEPIGKIGTIEPDSALFSITVNFSAPVLLANQVIHLQQKLNTRATIINISSGAAVRTIDGWAMYCSNKAAAKMYFDCLESQCEFDTAIRVFSVNPGVMDTKMQTKIRSTSKEEFPNVDRYKKLKENDQLQPPDDVAYNILKDCDLID
jgi:benzil reductase ((S)-benzoin forming)